MCLRRYITSLSHSTPAPELSAPEHRSPSKARSPSPHAESQLLRPHSSFTMPGSLFSRSSSLEPDSPPHDTEDPDRQVPPSSVAITPSRPPLSLADDPDQENEAGPSQSASKVPLRPKTIPSVKAVVGRFVIAEGDANPSILLPSPHSSPTKVRAPNSKRRTRGERYSSADESDYSPVKSKGKERAINFEPLAADTSGEIRVRGKEQELLTAREQQRRNERRWQKDKDVGHAEAEVEAARDKERIKMLELEVLRLKEEVRNGRFMSLVVFRPNDFGKIALKTTHSWPFSTVFTATSPASTSASTPSYSISHRSPFPVLRCKSRHSLRISPCSSEVNWYAGRGTN